MHSLYMCLPSRYRLVEHFKRLQEAQGLAILAQRLIKAAGIHSEQYGCDLIKQSDPLSSLSLLPAHIQNLKPTSYCQ